MQKYSIARNFIFVKYIFNKVKLVITAKLKKPHCIVQALKRIKLDN